MTQYIYNSLLAEVVQPLKALVLIKNNIKEDELGVVFKTYSKTIKDKINKVDKAELLELLIKEVIKIGLFAVPTL